MRMILVAVLLAGCTQLEATGKPTQPVPAPASSTKVVEPGVQVVGSEAEAAPSQEGFDFDSDALPPPGSEPEEALDPVALLALQQGVELEDLPVPAPEPVIGSRDEEPVASPPPEEPVYAWDPDTAAPATWGIRLLSTVNSTLPPRAVIGLPDGSEQVVQPGTMLPDQSVIVMAIGLNIVELAQVVPDGVQARVETQTVTALFPN